MNGSYQMTLYLLECLYIYVMRRLLKTWLTKLKYVWNKYAYKNNETMNITSSSVMCEHIL